MSHATRVKWLKITGIVLIAFGVIFAWTTTGPLSFFGEWFVDFAIFPFDGAQSYAATETRLLAAITGGLTAGVGAAVWLVTTYVYAFDPAVGRKIIGGFLLVWFVVDGIGSVLSGAPLNAALNVVILLALGIPLLSIEEPRTTTS